MNLKYSINLAGKAFYKKWKKDTNNSLFIASPIFLFLYLVCSLMIFGASLKLFLFLSWPLFLIIGGFIYTPYFKRKKYINNTIKTILIDDCIVKFETFKWFSYAPIERFINISNLEVKKTLDEPFFKNEVIYIIMEKGNESTFYLVEGFFDNFDDLLREITK